jgi:hypothetical protein
LPPLLDRFDDLSMTSSASGGVIDTNPVRSHDFDAGLAQAIASAAQLTYAVDGVYDFALRAYLFCQGCINDPLQAISLECSDDGTVF